MEPIHALFGLADNYHFLLLELVDTINSALLDTVSSDFLAEAGRIACESLRELALGNDSIDELTYHRMLRCTDEVEILAFYLVHHTFHFSEAHNTCNDVASYHKRRNIICEALVYHKVSRIREYTRLKLSNVAAEVIETVAARLASAVEVDTVYLLHNVNVIGYLKIRNSRLAELFYFNVLAVVLAYRYALVDDVRDNEHYLTDIAFELYLESFHFFKLCTELRYLSLYLFSLVLLTLSHKTADLLALYLALIAEAVALHLCFPVLLVELDNLVNEFKLFVLEFLLDILLDELGICSDKLNVDHFLFSFILHL